MQVVQAATTTEQVTRTLLEKQAHLPPVPIGQVDTRQEELLYSSSAEPLTKGRGVWLVDWL